MRTDAIDMELARRKMQRQDLAKLYGCTRQRMYVLLSRGTVTTVTAGRLAEALGVPVEQIARP